MQTKAQQLFLCIYIFAEPLETEVKFMKKWIAMVMMAAMSMSLAACGKNKESAVTITSAAENSSLTETTVSEREFVTGGQPEETSSDETIVPFCTSGGSGIGSSASNLEKLTSGATWMEGKRLSGSDSQDTVMEWVNSLEL